MFYFRRCKHRTSDIVLQFCNMSSEEDQSFDFCLPHSHVLDFD